MQIPSAPRTSKVNTWLPCSGSLKNKNGSKSVSDETVSSIEVYPDPYSSKHTVKIFVKESNQSNIFRARYSSPYLGDKIVIKQVN